MRKTILTICSALLLAGTASAQIPYHPVLHFDWDDMTSATQVTTPTSYGTYKGIFALTDKPAPEPKNVQMVAGEKALVFGEDNKAYGINFTSDVKVPAELAGNHAWTVRVRVYQKTKLDAQGTIFTWGGEPFSTQYQNANINFGTNNGQGRTGTDDTYNNGAYEHWNADGSFTTVPSAGTWHDLVLTYDGAHEIMYVDGTLDSDTDRTANPLNINGGVADATNFILGQGRTGWNPYTGAVSKIQAFGSALNQSQVTQLIANNMTGLPNPLVNVNISGLTVDTLTRTVANSGSLGGTFTSTYVFNPIVVPYVTERDGKKGLKLTGSTMYLGSLPTPLSVKGDHSFTAFYRVYNPSFQGTEPLLQWIDRTGASAGTYASPGFGSAGWGAMSQWGSADIAFPTLPSVNAWHDVAVVYNAATHKEDLYVDGISVVNVDRTLNLGGADYATASDSLYFGGMTDGSRATLVVNSLELYDVALTADQVNQLPGERYEPVNAARDWTLY